MKELVGPVVLLNRATGAMDAADVYRELDQKNFDDISHLWKPALDHNASEDAHWQWIAKATAAAKSMRYETFAVECAGVTQGLMLVDLGQYCRVVEHRNLELVYVALLASAPWNRPSLVANAQFKGVGRVLLGTAVSYSLELGFKGRIGLHSLSGSETWYRGESFTEFGQDPAKKMVYFEMTEQQAAAFIDG